MSNTWTYTLAYEDAVAMLGEAKLGLPINEWRVAASAVSRLTSGTRRTTQLRICERILRPVEGLISDDHFIRDLHVADDATAHDIIYARYLTATPLAVAVAKTLLAPRAQNGVDKLVSRDELDRMLVDMLPDAHPPTIARSRSACITEFARAGIIAPKRDGSFSVLRPSPSSLAFYYVLQEELAERREASDGWIARNSLAAALFALSPEQVSRHLEYLVKAGRLRRSYYGGEPRILAA